MFKFARITADKIIPEIVYDFAEIIFEDSPILYCGRNSVGDYVIGLSIDEDEVTCLEWFLHIPVCRQTVYDFLTGRISLLKIMREKKDIYLAEKSFSSSTLAFFQINTENIPSEYMPLEDSFCPDYFIAQYPRYLERFEPQNLGSKFIPLDLGEFSKFFSWQTTATKYDFVLQTQLFNQVDIARNLLIPAYHSGEIATPLGKECEDENILLAA